MTKKELIEKKEQILADFKSCFCAINWWLAIWTVMIPFYLYRSFIDPTECMYEFLGHLTLIAPFCVTYLYLKNKKHPIAAMTFFGLHLILRIFGLYLSAEEGNFYTFCLEIVGGIWFGFYFWKGVKASLEFSKLKFLVENQS
jgi:hypothetical protein